MYLQEMSTGRRGGRIFGQDPNRLSFFCGSNFIGEIAALSGFLWGKSFVDVINFSYLYNKDIRAYIISTQTNLYKSSTCVFLNILFDRQVAFIHR